MKLSTSFFIILPLVFFFAAQLEAQEDAATLHKRLADQLSSTQSVKLVATSSAMKNERISIRAKRSDKFVIELHDRIIICDGKTVWNYTPSRKSVVVSKYNSKNSSLSVEKILLECIGRYKPVSLSNEISTKGGTNYLLRLEASGAELFGVHAIVLSISKKSLTISKIEIESDQGKQDWAISSLKTNVPMNDSEFSFTSPKGVEVIDLRQ